MDLLKEIMKFMWFDFSYMVVTCSCCLIIKSSQSIFIELILVSAVQNQHENMMKFGVILVIFNFLGKLLQHHQW